MKSSLIKAILGKLKDAGLRPYIFKEAKSGSVYIKFKKNISGTLRISNHDERSRYSYRWNLRFDISKPYTIDKGHKCYYYPLNCIEEMITKMKMWADINSRSAEEWVSILSKS